MAKITSFPGNFIFENAKAPKIVVVVVHKTERIITITELKKYLPKGAMPKAVL